MSKIDGRKDAGGWRRILIKGSWCVRTLVEHARLVIVQRSSRCGERLWIEAAGGRQGCGVMSEGDNDGPMTRVYLVAQVRLPAITRSLFNRRSYFISADPIVVLFDNTLFTEARNRYSSLGGKAEKTVKVLGWILWFSKTLFQLEFGLGSHPLVSSHPA